MQRAPRPADLSPPCALRRIFRRRALSGSPQTVALLSSDLLPAAGASCRCSQTRTGSVLDEAPDGGGDVVAWTSYISRRCRSGSLSDAAHAFASMLSAGVRPNNVTFATLLSACADSGSPSGTSLPFGRAIHGRAFRGCGEAPERANVVLGTSLVDMYAKCGRAGCARRLFDGMTRRNMVSWNTMINGHMVNGEVAEAVSLFRQMRKGDKMSWTALINGFVRNGRLDEALECFREMQLHKIDPDYVTILCLVAACTDLGMLGQGLWVHRFAWARGLDANSRLCNSLVDMYSKCGRIDLARQLFERMQHRTLVSWNSMIVGFAINGYAYDALQHFSMMQAIGFIPDEVSFMGVLTACNHSGLVEKGLRYYHMMTRVSGISPKMEHYGCLVDLLSRTGLLRDAMSFVETMPMKPNEVVLGSLLAACRVEGDVGMAERVVKYIVEVEPEWDASYMLLSSVYATARRWNGVGQVRSSMRALGIKKTPAISTVEVDGNIHKFVADDDSHLQLEDIYSVLDLVSFEMEQQRSLLLARTVELSPCDLYNGKGFLF